MKKDLIIAALLSYAIADLPIWESKPEYLMGYIFLAMAAGLMVRKASGKEEKE